MKRRGYDIESFEWVVGGFLALLVGLVVWAGFAMGDEQEAWERNCEAQGGRVVEDSDVHTSVGSGSNGQPVVVVGTDTDYYCLNAQGGIISVR